VRNGGDLAVGDNKKTKKDMRALLDLSCSQSFKESKRGKPVIKGLEVEMQKPRFISYNEKDFQFKVGIDKEYLRVWD
jgi:hypothetical protein